ncbi:monovalent cation/H+ antiporter complex subunit F [Liberiplasma polymorphum]|jgi:multicomponent Na+:H+ antiporter subunit F|uniref:monovalent cation/H+ antiporter complex subunit F n=1 Tax=Liberiplasma polymorphum TaxID=3374570 RepID=UPI0037744D75
MSLLDWFLVFTLFLLILAILVSFIRLVIGPTIWDRILMINLISAKVIMFMVVFAIWERSELILDIAIAYGIVGFLTITLLSKYIMTGGREK